MRYGLIISAALILIIIAILSSKNYFNSPAVGTIDKSNQAADTSKPINKLDFEGKYFSFSYPSTFSLSPNSKVSGGELEDYSFTNNGTAAIWNLTVIVQNILNGQINNDGSYNYRKTYPNLFSEQQLTLGLNQIFLMTSKSGGYNKTAFIVHGGMDCNITLTSNSSIDASAMDSDLNMILASWTWL